MNVLNELRCPVCGAPEEDTTQPKGSRLNIRGFKVTDDHGRFWSCCMTGKHGRLDQTREHGYGKVKFKKLANGKHKIIGYEHTETVTEFWFCDATKSDGSTPR